MVNLKNMSKNSIFIKSMLFSTLLFFISILIGLYFKNELKDIIYTNLKIDNLNIGIISIFSNNFKVCLTNIILGILSLGLYNIFSLFTNGILLGLTFSVAIDKYSLYLAIIRIVPHGIFEIPSIIISNAFGFLVLILIYKKLNKQEYNIKAIINNCIKLIIIIIFLLIISAIIEGVISINIK